MIDHCFTALQCTKEVKRGFVDVLIPDQQTWCLHCVSIHTDTVGEKKVLSDVCSHCLDEDLTIWIRNDSRDEDHGMKEEIRRYVKEGNVRGKRWSWA